MQEINLDDGTADRFLLDARGVSLLVFTSDTCGDCRLARRTLPTFDLPVEHLCWIDAGRSGGLVARYDVFHLPALFAVRDGAFYGELSARLEDWDIRQQLGLAFDSLPAELP